MPVCFEFLVPVRDFNPSSLKALIGRILKEESCPGCDLTVIFTGSAHLRRLNRRYRGQDRVTDVISFAMLEGPKACWTRPNLGDVYISLPRARRQAREYCATAEEEIRRLTVHGVLHLLGFDHIQPGPARKMRRREEFYLYGNHSATKAPRHKKDLAISNYPANILSAVGGLSILMCSLSAQWRTG